LFNLLTSLLAIAMIASPSLAQAPRPGAIHIGLLLPLTGPDSARAKSAEEGVRLAAEEVNTAGGVLNRQLDIIVRDSQGTPETATSATRQLINDDLLTVIIGDLTTVPTLAAADECQRNRIPP